MAENSSHRTVWVIAHICVVACCATSTFLRCGKFAAVVSRSPVTDEDFQMKVVRHVSGSMQATPKINTASRNSGRESVCNLDGLLDRDGS